MTDLRLQLDQIANQFVSSILAAMKAASLRDLAANAEASPSNGTQSRGRRGSTRENGAGRQSAASTRAPGRRRRASAEEVDRQKNVAWTAAKALKSGFSKGDLMKKAGSKVDLGRALSPLVADGKGAKKGDRRLTGSWVK